MKNLLLLMLLLSCNVYAEEMYMANEAGGWVVLTDEQCAITEVAKQYQYRAYATESSDAVKHEGCWDTPDTSAAPTEFYSMSDGAPAAPKINLITFVNTWWIEGGRASFFQSNFSKEKKQIGKKNFVDVK